MINNNKSKTELIDSLKQTKTMLLQHKQRLEFLVNASPGVIYTAEASNNYGATFVSETVINQLGYKPSDFTDNAQFWINHVHPDDKLHILDGLSEVFNNDHYAHEYRFLHSNGHYVWMLDELKLIRDGEGNPSEIIGYWIDITERKHLEALLTNILDTLPANLTIVNEQGAIIMVNKGWRQFADTNNFSGQKHAIGMNYLEVCSSASGDWSEEAPLVENALRSILEGKQDQFYLEYPCHSPDEERWFALRITHFWLEDQIRVILMHTDITKQKQAEEHRRLLNLERSRIEVLSQFIMQASHEFRTPLTVITTNAYLLEKSTDIDKQKPLQRIKQQASHIETLVENMTTLSKLKSVQFVSTETINLNDILQDIYTEKQLEHQSKQILCTLDLSENPLIIQGNAKYLRHAIEHIWNNALNHTPDDGVIIIHSGFTDNKAVIKITDTGTGIDSDDLPYIFESFYRGDKAGSTRGFGLGLPIAKTIIKHAGGNIEVETELGRGTSFRIFLPI